MTRLLLRFAVFPVLISLADAAITITIAPDGIGGTTYSFSQTATNPLIPVAEVLSSSFRLELPPGMFDPIVAGGSGSSSTIGTFQMIGRFKDLNSDFTYDVVGLEISSVLAFAFFEFDRPFAAEAGQREVQFNLVQDFPGVLTISPDALVVGSHSIHSFLFGTVTVEVIPEPSSLSFAWLGTIALLKRRRMRP